MTDRNNFSDRNRVQNPGYPANSGSVDNTKLNVEADMNHDEDPDVVNARPASQDEIAYRNGYVQGQQRERVHENIQRTREENSTATGMVIGLVTATIVGLVLAAFYLLPQNRQPQVTPAPAASPAQPQNTQPQSTNRTTIIERVREGVPAPQNTEVIITPGSQPAQPAPTQPSVPQTTSPDSTSPDLGTQVNPDGTSTVPVDPAQSSSQPDGTGAVGQ